MNKFEIICNECGGIGKIKHSSDYGLFIQCSKCHTIERIYK